MPEKGYGINMNKYEKQANDFLNNTGTTFNRNFLYHGPYFEGEKDFRDVYEITLSRNNKTYTFKFGQSIAKSQAINAARRTPPTAYDVLACITKYDPGTFDEFCLEFGYNNDSLTAMKIYHAVQDEYKNINALFHDVMEDLEAIQ